MTTAVFKSKNDRLYSFTVSGHANYDEYGKDIVCSSITTAVFTSLNLIDRIIKKDNYQLKTDDSIGYVDFVLVSDNVEVFTIIENLLDVLTNIQKQYPKHLKIKLEK